MAVATWKVFLVSYDSAGGATTDGFTQGQVWLAPPPPVVNPEPPRLPTAFRPAWFVAAAVAGLAADAALRRPPWNNVAGSLLVLALLGGLAGSGLIRTRTARLALALAAVFGVFLSLRTNPQLIAFNMLAIASLVVVATLRPRNVFNYRPLQALGDVLRASIVPVELLASIPQELHSRRYHQAQVGTSAAGTTRAKATASLSALGRGVALAAPAVLVLALLLASADAVFASFFASPISPGDFMGHLLLIALGVGAMAVLLRLATTKPDSSSTVVSGAPSLGRIETYVILGSINALFALFAFAQLLALTDAGASTLAEQGLTYKEYARQGFFQLLWVAGITLVLLLGLRSMAISWARHSRIFQGLGLVSVVLTLVIVAVAYGRLQLYISDGGLTPLRFYSSVFSLWVGLAFVLVGLRLLNVRADAAWTMPALAGSGLLILLVLNVANPEAIMANNLLDLDRGAILLHMEKLTGDGEAVLADGIDRLSPELREEVRDKLCAPDTRFDPNVDVGDQSGGGLLDWNRGERRQDKSLERLCSG